MEKCPLCGNKASIDLPEWIGGRFSIKCNDCGEFATNSIVITELERLRAEASPRIGEIKYSIEIADHLWYLNWSQRLGMIILEAGQPRELTKHQKRGLRDEHRRGKSSNSTGSEINFVYVGNSDAENA